MDEYFDYFYNSKGFGPAIKSKPVLKETLAKYQNRLPDQLLEYWQQFGFCGWGNGLFWTVNPDDYEDVLEAWLGETDFVEKEELYVIARSAFGKLYVWGKKSGQSIKIDPVYSRIYPSEDSITRDEQDNYIRMFFGFKKKNDLDYEDNKNKPLFDRAVKKLGVLESQEMYGFEPALIFGSEPKLENLRKLPIISHLQFLASLDKPQIMLDIGKFVEEQGLDKE